VHYKYKCSTIIDHGYERIARPGGQPDGVVLHARIKLEAERSLTSCVNDSLVGFCSGGFRIGHRVPECLDIFFHKVTVVHGPEQNPTLPLTLPLSTITAALGPATSRQSSPGRSSGWGEQRGELDVAVPDRVSPLLL